MNRMVYKMGTIVGRDKAAIRECLSKFNSSPAVQLMCTRLEAKGEQFLEKSSLHGSGVAAKQDIPAGTDLCYYIGVAYDAAHNPPGNHCIELGVCGSTRIVLNASSVPRDRTTGTA